MQLELSEAFLFEFNEKVCFSLLRPCNGRQALAWAVKAARIIFSRNTWPPERQTRKAGPMRWSHAHGGGVPSRVAFMSHVQIVVL